MLAVEGTAQHHGGRTRESGGVSCKSAGEAVSVTARQLIEAIQRGGGGLFAGGGGLFVDLGLFVEAVGAGQPHLGGLVPAAASLGQADLALPVVV